MQSLVPGEVRMNKANDVKAIQYTYIPGNTNEEWIAHLEASSAEWM